jgi:hypothetical protein
MRPDMYDTKEKPYGVTGDNLGPSAKVNAKISRRWLL